MSDTTPNAIAVAPPVSLDSAIDKLVALSASRNSTSVQGNPGSLEVRVTPGEAPKVIVHTPPTPSTGDAARMHDSGIDIPSSVAKLESTLKAAEESLTRIAGYSPVDGTPIYVYPQGSPERATAERHLQQLRTSTAFDLQQMARLQNQRTADAAKTSAADREAALTAAFHRGSPERQAMLKEAIAKAEADEVAAQILAARKAGR